MSNNSPAERFDIPEAANNLLANAQLAVILGSGIDFCGADRAQSHLIGQVKYTDIRGMPPTTVAGHSGTIQAYQSGSHKVLIFKGRYHLYEGHSPHSSQATVRLARQLKVPHILITNAAGGVSDRMHVGDIILHSRLIQIQNSNHEQYPSIEINTKLSTHLKQEAIDKTLSLQSDGTYMAVMGPNYETEAEIKLFRRLGVDAVGMSTYFEAYQALKNDKPLDIAVLSLITNSWAESLSNNIPPTHEEVLENAKQGNLKINQVIHSIIDRYLT